MFEKRSHAGSIFFETIQKILKLSRRCASFVSVLQKEPFKKKEFDAMKTFLCIFACLVSVVPASGNRSTYQVNFLEAKTRVGLFVPVLLSIQDSTINESGNLNAKVRVFAPTKDIVIVGDISIPFPLESAKGERFETRDKFTSNYGTFPFCLVVVGQNRRSGYVYLDVDYHGRKVSFKTPYSIVSR